LGGDIGEVVVAVEITTTDSASPFVGQGLFSLVAR